MKKGFTLIETIIYVALFGILMVGVIASIRPIFAGVESMSEKIMIENEITLVSRTIVSLIPQAQSVSAPNSGATGNTLTLTTYSNVNYSFKSEGGAIVASVFPSPWTPLTASRVRFDDMIVKRVPASADGTPAYIEINYVVEGITYGPIRSYLNF